ncbi:hypothetical protein HBI56_231570 [Parastagonospora nodorum]|nr:hypothetical protein HBI06_198120 [Parastagonospora nodorum]KAH4225179.1 hypothetical protein HBI05_230410 [Parastagonospora nodorum]KAH5054987.1 hypothetical protein HBI73_223630 [Parastagonospora nodorum]KAH5061022.1 hypothetical protein HBH95_231190 [Parastagonospora nodorum]KAH5750246.1 hypothetical protein HBI97_240550 [Parastagonospora nodorum]
MYSLLPFASAGLDTTTSWSLLCLLGVLAAIAVKHHYTLPPVLLEAKVQQVPVASPVPTVQEVQEAPPPKRLVVCVDGTWGCPDGTAGSPEGNISTVYRVYASVKEGYVTDKATGKRWDQQRVYFNGLGNKLNALKNLHSGAFGSGLPDEIRKVYEYCCRETDGPDDEIYFFGFSRGAFTVRAVANLLCYMHVPKGSQKFSKEEFTERYKELLELYPGVRASDRNIWGQIHSHFNRSTRPPTIRFIGAFDTVKKFTDNGLYDVMPHSQIHHYRHALALNEERDEFKPETMMPDNDACSPGRSGLQAWFIGTHRDLGGANSKDGLSLYPLQWVLSEANALGLVLEFSPIKLDSCNEDGPGEFDDDPLNLIMPLQSKRQETPSKQSEMSLSLENRIRVRIWDLCDVHEIRQDDFKVKLNSTYWGPAHRLVLTIKPRQVFDGDTLIGYRPDSPTGTFIHPSVYQVLDENPGIRDVSGGWPFTKALALFRHRVIPDEREIFWVHPSPAMKRKLEKIRILICGDAGVGKSTLINQVLKGNYSPVNNNTHQQHNVEKEITGPDLPYIVHDSEGFQSGASNKEASAVRDFLRIRSREPTLPMRVHTIWYCVLAGTQRESRPDSESDKDLFTVLNECKSTIPVVVICTKVDTLKDTYRGQEFAKLSSAELADKNLPAILEARIAIRVENFKKKIETAFKKTSQGYPYMAGPVFTSEMEQKSIRSLVGVTYDNLNNDQVRAMFSQAQGIVVDLKVKEAIKESLRLYKHAVRTSAVPLSFSGSISTTVVAPMIVGEISKIFNFDGISGDIAWRCLANVLVSNATANVVQMFSQAIGVAGAVMAETGIGAVPGLMFVTGAAAVNIVSTPQFSRALLMCTLDTILIMDHAFWQCDDEKKKIEKEHIDQSAQWFTDDGRSSKVHADIKNLIKIWNPFDAFDYTGLETEMNAIVERYRYRPTVEQPVEEQSPSPVSVVDSSTPEKSFWQGWFGQSNKEGGPATCAPHKIAVTTK